LDNVVTTEPTVEEADQIQQMIQHYLAEVEQLRQRMQQDQSEFEASRARTDVMLTRIQAQLTQLQAS
jgi:hypothetical protein